MQYLALATDYDGTLAKDGHVSSPTLAALERLRQSGRKLILVTGRQLDDLSCVFPQMSWFDCVIAENGALLYWVTSGERQQLGDRPSPAFFQALQDQQVEPLTVGDVIVATWKPHDVTVAQVIQDLGLDLQIILNKDAVMVLPSGINKAVGLQAALDKMNLAADAVVGVGDAENDGALLDLCGFAVAVANALPLLKERADWVTTHSRGDGVAELIDYILTTDRAGE